MSKDTICAPWRSGRGLSEAIFDVNGHFVASVGGRTQSEIRERSALVATAPELLAACKRYLNQSGNGKESMEIRALMDAAVAKAEGLQS